MASLYPYTCQKSLYFFMVCFLLSYKIISNSNSAFKFLKILKGRVSFLGVRFAVGREVKSAAPPPRPPLSKTR